MSTPADGHTLTAMASAPWRVILLVLGGAAVGIAIAGLPNQREDPPLRVVEDTTTSSTTTTFATTTTELPTTTSSSLTTRTTRRP